ncbi:chemotaxis protein CheR [soil metagenome]
MNPPRGESELRLLLDAIHLRYHYDFRNYAMDSLARRVEAARTRMACASITALQERILRDGRSFTQLLSFLTVQVSEMFRDPSFFKTFRERIVPTLATYPSLRLWIAGCSSGEEVYSFAIVLREEGLLERTTIYATDINGSALEKAEAGIYAIDRIPGFTENHRASGGPCSLSTYYSAAYGSAIFDRTLRAKVVFSDHSLATDNVFAEVHVVSCRNVLIYFDRELQARALGVMKDALIARGYLGIGPKESIRFSPHRAELEPFVESERWYRKR